MGEDQETATLEEAVSSAWKTLISFNGVLIRMKKWGGWRGAWRGGGVEQETELHWKSDEADYVRGFP